MVSRNPSIDMIEVVAGGLKELLDEVVFVGGATASLYIEDPAAIRVRPTDDVDCIIEIVNRKEYYKLESQIRELGFSHAIGEGNPICRWKFEGVTVDIMPIDPAILGFSNIW